MGLVKYALKFRITFYVLSIPSLMGAIMSVGVACANSILLVTFAREHREETGASAVDAAMEAGRERLRPALMTALAMFVGLIPMALGLGDGSEQNAALIRAVMGGVAFATCSTLLFNGQGLRVAVIGQDDMVHMQDVSILRDLGTTVELRDGLQGGERVALSPPVDLADGQRVKVQASPAGKDKA